MKQIIAIIFSWFIFFQAKAEEELIRYKITKEWNSDVNTEFELQAKSQNFKVDFWDKNLIRMEFTLVSSSSEIDAEDFKNRLKIEEQIDKNKISISTKWDQNNSSVWDKLFNPKKAKNNYTLENIIYLPKNIASLTFILDYCNLNISEMDIATKIITNYCELSILKNTNKTTINSNYTDIELGDLRNVKLNSAYSDLILNKIDTLQINSNYGNIKIQNCNFLQNLNINYGDVNIGKIGYLKSASTYSDIKINQVMQQLIAALTYSDLTVSNIDKNISDISITGSYSDCSLKINPANDLNLSLKTLQGDIVLNNKNIVIINQEEKDSSNKVEAKTKNATQASPFIKVTSKNSAIIIN